MVMTLEKKNRNGKTCKDNWSVGTRHFQMQGCNLLRGTAKYLGKHSEKNICWILLHLLLNQNSLFQPAVPTSSKHHFSMKTGRVCRLILPTLMPAWGVGGVFRELHIKLYLMSSPLAQAVGKTYCYFSSEITSFKNVSSVCLQKARSHSTWSSKQFGWPCQLNNIQSNKKKYDWQNSHNKTNKQKNPT